MQDGGGIRSIATSPIIKNCIIDSCTSDIGGGINLESSQAQLINCTINNNSALGTDNSKGGGIFITKFSDVDIINCSISFNQSSHGGGIHVDGQSKINLAASSINNNIGMGLQLYYAEANLLELIIENNDGGGINMSNSNTSIEKSIIKYNSINVESNSNFNLDNSLVIDTLWEVINCYSANKINISFSSIIAEKMASPLYLYNNSDVNIINSIVWSENTTIINGNQDSVNISYSNIKGG